MTDGWLARGRSLLRTAPALLSTPHVGARALAVADSRALVRSWFLSSAIRAGWLDVLATPRGATITELAERIGASRTDRLEAWLAVGVELGELSLVGGRYRIRGRRARAVASGDAMLSAHYRSVLDYQAGPYDELVSLLQGPPGTGRGDLDRYADEIAQVSLAAMAFVAPAVRDLVNTVRPRAVLDAGCGTAVYSRVVLEADPATQVIGVDLSEEVIRTARSAFDDGGHGARIELIAADLRSWAATTSQRFDVVMLHNNIYYFDPEGRSELLAGVGELLRPGGEILLTTMTTPGSVASAHLHLMLLAQAGTAALPTQATLRADFAAAGLEVVSLEHPVPMEPYVVVRAVTQAVTQAVNQTV